MTDENKSLAQMAMDKTPVDFKEELTSHLNDALRSAICDFKEELSEGLVNKDDLTDKKPEPGTKKASDPKATNPGPMGHKQTDEKKSGSKQAKEPKPTE